VHYALTIQAAHFPLKIVTEKILNHGHLPCLFFSWGLNPGPHALHPTLASNPIPQGNVSGPELMQHLLQLLPGDFLVFKVSIYTEIINTAFKAVLSMGASQHSMHCCV
jgi:hypothetical protein